MKIKHDNKIIKGLIIVCRIMVCQIKYNNLKISKYMPRQHQSVCGDSCLTLEISILQATHYFSVLQKQLAEKTLSSLCIMQDVATSGVWWCVSLVVLHSDSVHNLHIPNCWCVCVQLQSHHRHHHHQFTHSIPLLSSSLKGHHIIATPHKRTI